MCCLYQRTATYFSLLSVLLVTISITLTTPTQAQIADVGDLSPVIITGVGLSGGFPSGEFGKNITNSGIGLSGYFGYRLSKTPAVVGIDLGYLIYGYERRTEQFSLTIPDVLVAVVTENSLFSMNTFFRLQKWDGRLRLYVEGLVGFHYLFTKTKIEDLHPRLLGEEIASSTNLGDFAFTKGASCGILIKVWDNHATRTQLNRKIRSVSIDIRIRYQDGSSADYLKRGAIVRRAGVAELNVTKSAIDLLTAHIGLAIDF